MTNVTRRTFLASSAVAATAVGLNCNFGYSADKKPGANEQLGVMVVGCGGRGRGSHVREFLKDPRTTILYVCDPDTAQAEKAAAMVAKQQGSKPKIIRDMREALSDSSLDIVSCASANHWHALCGVWAMQAKKHAYLEKPICHNIHEGKALIAAAKKYDCICQVGSQCRSNPAVKEAFEWLAKGGIGEIKLARGLCYKRRKAIGPLGKYSYPETLDYNLWSGPAPMVDPVTRPQFHYDWHWQRLFGNGDSGNQGPHQTDIARSALGVTEFPISVITYGGRLGYPEEKKDPNYVDAGDTANTEVSIFNYADGKTLVFETRGLESEDYRGAKIGVVAYGTEGYWVQVNYSKTIAYDKSGKVIREFTGGGDSFHFDNFITAILEHKPEMLNADARCGHLSAGLAHMGNISYYLGEENKVSPEEAAKVIKDVPGNDDNLDTLKRTCDHLAKNKVDLKKTPISLGPMLKFDCKTEKFTNNAEASKAETRDYRGEFVVPDAANV
ncbi:MAG: Gfo/Idh/MocA family oxidoreductase [Planctomycetia bacterium]|nr:Gfo/Idh/MocA family oxidoreductase [Planctomycetia bacterium]